MKVTERGSNRDAADRVEEPSAEDPLEASTPAAGRLRQAANVTQKDRRLLPPRTIVESSQMPSGPGANYDPVSAS
jgi:hypothetical protein